MWKEMMILNGTIEDKNGNEIDSERLFNILSDNGYEVTGGYEVVKKEDLNKAVEDIVASISYNDFLNMVEKFNDIYLDRDSESIRYFFETNSGTGSFNQVINAGISDDMKKLYDKYTNTNWQISDEFGANLGWEIVEKFKEQLK